MLCTSSYQIDYRFSPSRTIVAGRRTGSAVFPPDRRCAVQRTRRSAAGPSPRVARSARGSVPEDTRGRLEDAVAVSCSALLGGGLLARAAFDRVNSINIEDAVDSIPRGHRRQWRQFALEIRDDRSARRLRTKVPDSGIEREVGIRREDTHPVHGVSPTRCECLPFIVEVEFSADAGQLRSGANRGNAKRNRKRDRSGEEQRPPPNVPGAQLPARRRHWL